MPTYDITDPTTPNIERVRVTVRLDASFKATLEEQAHRERRDLSSHMEYMLERYYKYMQAQTNRGKSRDDSEKGS